MHVAKEDSSSLNTADTMLHQVIVKVPHLKCRPLKKAVPAAKVEAAVPHKSTKAVGQQTCTSWKAAEEAMLDDKQEVAISKICDHLNQDLTPDYDGMPDLVEYSDDKDDIAIPTQTKKDDKIATAIIESYSPCQFKKAKTIVHSNDQDIHSKFLSYVPPVTL